MTSREQQIDALRATINELQRDVSLRRKYTGISKRERGARARELAECFRELNRLEAGWTVEFRPEARSATRPDAPAWELMEGDAHRGMFYMPDVAFERAQGLGARDVFNVSWNRSERTAYLTAPASREGYPGYDHACGYHD